MRGALSLKTLNIEVVGSQDILALPCVLQVCHIGTPSAGCLALWPLLLYSVYRTSQFIQLYPKLFQNLRAHRHREGRLQKCDPGLLASATRLQQYDPGLSASTTVCIQCIMGSAELNITGQQILCRTTMSAPNPEDSQPSLPVCEIPHKGQVT